MSKIKFRKENKGYEFFSVECYKNNISYSDYYLIKHDNIAKIVDEVTKRNNCIIFGLPRSQKSFTLQMVMERLCAINEFICIKIDLEAIKYEPLENFIKSFTHIFIENLMRFSHLNRTDHPTKLSDGGDNYYENLINHYLKLCDKKVVLMVDHVEKLRLEPLNLLIKMFGRLNDNQPNKIIHVISCSIIVADKLIHDKSFLNSAFIMHMNELGKVGSGFLIDSIFEAKKIKVPITAGGRNYLIEQSRGCRFLIIQLCEKIAKCAKNRPETNKISKHEVNRVVNRFIELEADKYIPLQETAQAIENNPAILDNVLSIIDSSDETIHKSQNNRKSKIERMQSCGIVCQYILGEYTGCRMRNPIYNRYLKNYFNPERVIDIYITFNDWSKACYYLEKFLDNRIQYRRTYLKVIVNMIYSLRDKEQALNLFGSALEKAFCIKKYRIYIENPERTQINLAWHKGLDKPEEKFSIRDKERIEIKTILGTDYVVTQHSPGDNMLLMPLRKDDKKRLGLLAIHDIENLFEIVPQNVNFQKLINFVQSAGRAIGKIIDNNLSLKRLAKLSEMGTQIGSGEMTPAQILNETVINIVNVSEVKAADMVLYSDPKSPYYSQEPELHESYGFPFNVEQKLKHRRNGLTEIVRQKIKPQFVCDKDDSPGINPTILKRDPDIKACLCLPMVVRENIIGILYLYYNEEQTFDDNRDEIEIMSLFTKQAAAAIKIWRQATNLKAVQDISVNIVSGFERDRILQTITKSITELLRADRSLFFLLNHKNREVRVLKEHGYPKDYILDYDEIMDGLTGWVIDNNQSAISEDASRDYRQKGRAKDKAKKLNSGPIIVVPLRNKGEISGTLTVIREKKKKKPPPFTMEDLELANMLTNHASIAIENAKLYQENRVNAFKTFHTIKGRISAIQGEIETIRNLMTGSRVESSFQNMYSCAKSLKDTLDTLIALSKPSKGIKTKFETIDFKSLFNDITTIVPKGVIKLSISKELQNVKLPKELLNNALIEIVSNAKKEILKVNKKRIYIKVTPIKKELRKKFTGRFPKGGVLIQIVNEGVGVPEEYKERIWELGYSRKEGGTGMGLFIAAQAIEDMNGICYEDGIPGENAVFNLLLPNNIME